MSEGRERGRERYEDEVIGTDNHQSGIKVALFVCGFERLWKACVCGRGGSLLTNVCRPGGGD